MEERSTMLKPDALLFDMDGTLWDGVNAYAQGFNDFFKAHGIKRSFTKKDLFKYMGMEEEPFLALILPEFTAVERKTVYREIIELQYKRIETYGGELYEGVKEGLSKLAETPVGLGREQPRRRTSQSRGWPEKGWRCWELRARY